MRAGQLVTALWVVIPRLTFANSCLATVFYSVGMVMVAKDGHIGSRLKAMVVIPGAWWVGSVCGGFTVSIPELSLVTLQNHHAYSLAVSSSAIVLVQACSNTGWIQPRQQLDDLCKSWMHA